MVTMKELVAEIGALSHRLAVAEAVLAVQGLKARYGELVDRRFSKGAVVDEETLRDVADRIAALFTADGVWDGGPGLGRVEGRQAIATRLRDPTLCFSRHLFVNPRIEAHGPEARARWDLLTPCARPDGTSWWMCGYEDDEYRCVEGTWLHRSMKLTTVFMAPAPGGWSPILV
jgi:hypothetical protein